MIIVLNMTDSFWDIVTQTMTFYWFSSVNHCKKCMVDLYAADIYYLFNILQIFYHVGEKY